MKCIGYIAISLDGFIARKDGGLDWLDIDTGGDDCGFKDFLLSIDAMIMGRVTFQKILEIGQWVYGDIPVFVPSTTLQQKDVPEHLSSKLTVVQGTPTSLMEDLKAKGKKRVYVDGGKTVQSFIQEGLLDELTLTQFPVLLGTGIPLFGETKGDVKWELVNSKAFAFGLVQNHYKLLKRGL
jgi:dihydrofolate reductase